MSATEQAVTYLFSDIEGSTRLWENEPERMRPAVAHHFAILDAAIARHRGVLVKKTGDGVHAAFDRATDAVAAVVDMQLGLREPNAPGGIGLKIRCGLHWGLDERRDGDFYGTAVNRAARIMSIAHGGQILVSQAVAERAREALPDGVSLRDLGTVRLRDLSTPERVYQVVHAALRAEFPALRSLEATPNNLAQQLNSFVGRERELQEVRELLARNRLVTLLGMGGLGKSRLSVQLAAEVLEDYPDGVWMVELAPVSDPELVPQAVATVLGVKEDAGRSVLEALQKFIRDRKILIVLDNCEHVVQACADLAKRLLQSGPLSKVLASSRDALQIAGETVFHVAPLPAPPVDATHSADSLRAIDAVRLFIDRATAAQPAFRLTDRSAPAVAAICRRLDGIPLALELAAARLRALSVEAIAARLDDRFKLLVSGDRTALPRQRTLRALIDWSYDLLNGDERALFQALSVFAGGWELDAAEAVAVGMDLDPSAALDLQTSLVEKSLVIADIEGGRYRMLETVRQYAQEKLDEARTAVAVRDKHLAFYVDLVEAANNDIAGASQADALLKLDRERENILTAHAWCDRSADGAALGLRLVFAFSMGFYLLTRGLLALGERLSTEALARPLATPDPLRRCQGLATAGKFQFYRGRYTQARAHLEESLALARSLNNRARILGALQPLGMTCLGSGDSHGARSYLEEAVAIAEQGANLRSTALAVGALAQFYRSQGKLDTAESLCDRMLAIAREAGAQDVIAIALLNRAMVSISLTRADGVAQMLLEALEIGTRTGSKPTEQSVLEVASGLASSLGQPVAAARFFGAAEAQAQITGLRRDPTDEAFLSTLMGRVRAALSEASFAEAEASGRRQTYEEAIATVRQWLMEAR